ncbi:unnamed protein product [Vitrella brassicaformis CCMP3155]|uniref:Protein kinase domain-containing protein n=1 Tax=Vitrella brassicaformis (strain CCMP3155) TaxID=1169540 RepID=A0A0G4EJZ5_VITBC|nr:unnamed protein product [Vitrella brassicaformis CCMP3155]|eukprot:CEL96835.1 unnamed protein product [Vitrella brassicaformis CCMP3155]
MMEVWLMDKIGPFQGQPDDQVFFSYDPAGKDRNVAVTVGATHICKEIMNMPLAQRLRAGGPLEEDKARERVVDVLCGLVYLHSKRLAHGCLSTSTVLVEAFDGTAKLAGFGHRRSTQRDTGFDILALGRLVAEMVSPQDASSASDQAAVPQIPHSASPELQDFVQVCLEEDPAAPPPPRSCWSTVSCVRWCFHRAST